jgi:alpha-glucosidase
VAFRAYNDGVAYRFSTSLSGEVQVYDEDITVFLPQETDLVLQQSHHYQTSYEERYTFVKAAQWQSHHPMAHYPILAITPGGTKILMSEATFRTIQAPSSVATMPEVSRPSSLAFLP